MGQRLSEPEHPNPGAPDPPQWVQRLQTAGPSPPHPALRRRAGQKWPRPASQALLRGCPSLLSWSSGLVGEAVTDQTHHKRHHYKVLWTYTFKIFPKILGVGWGCSSPSKSPKMWELSRAASGTPERAQKVAARQPPASQSLCSSQPPSCSRPASSLSTTDSVCPPEG